MQLREALNLYGRAVNKNSAWGYSPYPIAERLDDGKIKVTTYHFESEWKEEFFDSAEEVDFHLYTENGSVVTSSGGKSFKAEIILDKEGDFRLDCSIDGKSVSIEEYRRTFPQKWKEDGEWLPRYWDGPGKWGKDA